MVKIAQKSSPTYLVVHNTIFVVFYASNNYTGLSSTREYIPLQTQDVYYVCGPVYLGETKPSVTIGVTTKEYYVWSD